MFIFHNHCIGKMGKTKPFPINISERLPVNGHIRIIEIPKFALVHHQIPSALNIHSTQYLHSFFRWNRHKPIKRTFEMKILTDVKYVRQAPWGGYIERTTPGIGSQKIK